MNSEQKYYLSITAILASAFIAFVYSFAFYYAGKNERLAEMVKSGVSPFEAACALNDALGQNPTCVILAMKK